MAFIPGSIAEKQVKTTATASGGFVPGSIAKQATIIQSKTSGFVPGSIAGSPISSKSLQTSQGLYNLASQKGLKNRADDILNRQSGEETKKIFSGGFISDIFDVVNSLQYGVVGMVKGKSFAEGVKTRQSFSDKDALGDHGIPGVIAGIVLDIAFDPLTYIAPVTILRKIPGAVKLGKVIKGAAFGKKITKTIDVGAEATKGISKTYQATEGGTEVGKYLASKLVYMNGADPVFKETFERGVKNIAVETTNIVDMSKAVAKLTPETASKLLTKDETGRFIRVGLDKLTGKLNPGELDIVTKFYTKLDDLGKQAVDLGLLSKTKYEENIGEYIKNAYMEYEQMANKGLFGIRKVGIKGIKKRVEGLTPEMMKDLGQIDNPAYLLFKSTFDLAKDVENAKMFKQVAEKFGTDIAQEGFTQIPKTSAKLGGLAGKYIPTHMSEYLNEIIQPSTDTVAKKLVANFKFFKVVMNPATHARNIMSNKLLNYWKLGMNPLDPRTISSDAEAIKEVFRETGKWIDEARPLGYGVDTFASAEMKGLLNSPEASVLNKAGSLWQKTKQTLGNIYQKEESQAKLSAYIFNRKYKNLEPEEAWKVAESATFNYAQVTPFVRKMRESLFGFPFITFTIKATPIVAETLIKNPQRIGVIGKIKQAIENLSDIKETDRERALEPSWVKDGFYVKLPMKDSLGRSAYFDLTYILPFGDLMSGNWFERAQNIQTGVTESMPISLMKRSPFIQLVTELGRNKDFYGNKIWKESDSSEQQALDLSRHLIKTMAPPLVSDQIPGGYNEKGVQQQKGIIGALTPQDKENQQRTIMEELLRNIGAKIQPIDADIQETYEEWNKKKGLQTLLLENGELNTFTRQYLPKIK